MERLSDKELEEMEKRGEMAASVTLPITLFLRLVETARHPTPNADKSTVQREDG